VRSGLFIRNTGDMAETESKSVQCPDQTDVKEHDTGEVLSAPSFIVLAATVLAVVIPTLVAIFTTANTWTMRW
jgi:hypothetical protein